MWLVGWIACNYDVQTSPVDVGIVSVHEDIYTSGSLCDLYLLRGGGRGEGRGKARNNFRVIKKQKQKMKQGFYGSHVSVHVFDFGWVFRLKVSDSNYIF